MAVAPLTITAARTEVIDFSMPFFEVGLSILIKRRFDFDTNLAFQFLKPFSEDTWLCILLVFVACFVTLFMVSRISPSQWRLQARVIPKNSLSRFELTVYEIHY